MYNKNGFTLLELLIAAALVGVLAMFATQAFRASASDIRVEDAKARALLLANAAEQYFIENSEAAFATGSAENPIKDFVAPVTCNTSDSTAQQLVNCGFLEYRQVKDNNVNMWFEAASKAKVKVCFQGQGRVQDKCTYCTDGDSFTKSCPSN